MMRRLSFLLSILALTALGLAAAGCTHPCLKLAEQICECEPGEIEKEACEREMKSAYDSARVNELKAQADTCTELLDTCDCTRLDTEEGRQACGLARTP
ncbi:MAG: hypothetical protein P1V51_12780 [Deltaproteobacteria bacterium]|nr:hypothetical protein [Deltaproteobacteria bacterium]